VSTLFVPENGFQGLQQLYVAENSTKEHKFKSQKNSPVFNEMQNESLAECCDVSRDVSIMTSCLLQ